MSELVLLDGVLGTLLATASQEHRDADPDSEGIENRREPSMTVASTQTRPYRGRTLNGRTDGNGWQPGWSDAAVEAIQAINQLTVVKEPLPVPVIEDLLSNLKHVGYELPQALDQLSRSLAPAGHSATVSRGHGQATGAAVAEAREHLAHAARRAAELGALLEAAQSAIESS